MALSILNLSPDLRPWSISGLNHVLLPGPLRQDPVSQAPEPAATPARKTPEHLAAPSAKPDSPAARPGHAAVAKQASPSSVDQENLVAFWPEQWRSFYGKLNPSPSLWSYFELGQDLFSLADPKRSATLKSIISALRLPKGTSSFLPAALPAPGESELRPEPAFFQAGLARINPKLLIIFGRDVLAITPYDRLALKHFQESVVKGRLILLLPPFEEVTASQSTMDSTVVFLKSAFDKIRVF